MAGILRERSITAKDVKALNHSFVHATEDFDGGNVMALAHDTKGDVKKASLPTTGKLTGLAMAYNPSVRYTKVNGKVFAGLSADERDYTNIAGVVGDCFIPQVGDEIGLTKECIEGGTAAVGNFLEAQNNKKTLKVNASTMTANTLALEVVRKETEMFPKAGIGNEAVDVYICVVRAN